MPRFFNTAGPCNPVKHYMLLPESRLPRVRSLIDRELYFVVHAPRQTGKTTIFEHLARSLTAQGRYTALHASCETGQVVGGDVERGIGAVLQAITLAAELQLPPELRPDPLEEFASVVAEGRLAFFLSRWTRKSDRPVVLFLDEIDALRDEVLLSVLRQLRSGYSGRPTGFPQSLALIGLRDVRDSAFNVKVESLVLRNFNAGEIGELYAQHTAETGQTFLPETIDCVYELTRGQPWLVNALARQIVEEQAWDPRVAIKKSHVERAKEVLIKRRGAHLDSLVDRLREPRVQRVLEPILAGELLSPDLPEDDVRLVMDLGLVSPALEITNPIYREIIREP